MRTRRARSPRAARPDPSSCASQVCLPDWPWWNRHPLNWLEVPEEEDEKPTEKKKKKKSKEAKEADKAAAAAAKVK